MNWLLTMVLCTVLVEIVLHLPFLDPLGALRRSGKRAVRAVTAKAVSDHWKEKAMGAYARKTFIASIKIAGLVALVLGAATLLVLAMDQLCDGFQAFILSWTGLGASAIAATLYVVARKAVIRGPV